jgi:hypothetical protein
MSVTSHKVIEGPKDEAEMIALTARLREIAERPVVSRIRVRHWRGDILLQEVIYASSLAYLIGRRLPIEVTHFTIDDGQQPPPT